MISFFAPWMLLGLGFASIPILLHIFRRRTAKRVVWAAWQFVAESMRRQRRRVLLEDLLLLLLRTLVLMLAALACARPFLPEMHAFGGGPARDVVLVMDVSASMGLVGTDGRTRLQAAVAEAKDLVRHAPPRTSFAVLEAGSLASAGRAVVHQSMPFSGTREILATLDRLAVGAGTMDAPEALAAASEVLAAGTSPVKEIVVYGDGQAVGWQADDPRIWSGVERTFARFESRPSITWRTLGTGGAVPNAAIESFTASRRLIGTDRPVTFSTVVLNAGTEAVDPGELVFSVDGVACARRTVGLLMPGLSRTLDFSHRFATNGAHTVVASLTKPDAFEADNVATNLVDVLDAVHVLLVNGRPERVGFDSPAAYLDAAFMGGVTSRTVRASFLEKSESLTNFEVVVLCDVARLSPASAGSLSAFTASGGGLLVVPAEKADPGFYGSWMRNEALVLPTVWKEFRDGRALFDESALTNDVVVARRFEDGAPAFVTGTFGRGRTGIYAEPLHAQYNAVPTRPEFVPLVHGLIHDLWATNSVTPCVDTVRRAREADLTSLDDERLDALRVHVDLSRARQKEDVLAAVLGERFGQDIWFPFVLGTVLLLVFEVFLARFVDRRRRGDEVTVVPRLRDVPSWITVFRTLAFLAAIWMLLHLSWGCDVARTIHRRVAVVTDHSRSMTRADAPGVRFALATNVARRLELKLGERYDVEPIAFGGETTSLAAALEEVLTRIPEEELAGAVFVTDGRATDDGSVEAACRRFAHVSARVATVLVGAETNRADAAIVSVATPQAIFLGDKVRVGVNIRADDLKGRRATVRFCEGDREIDRREFPVDADAWVREMRFVADPAGLGIQRYRVTLEVDGGEEELANNEWPIEVAVSDDRTNVLLVDRRPRWDFRYLRNLFYGRDKSVNLQYVLAEPDLLPGAGGVLPAASAARAFGDAEAGSLPANREEWRRFDVVIVGDVSPRTLTPDVVAHLKDCVEERGATLVVVAGPGPMPSAFARSAFADLLPVTVTNEFGRVAADWQVQPAVFALSPSGLGAPLMALADSASENARLWNSLPPISARCTGVGVRPGADVLAYAGGSTVWGDPLLVVQHRGRGKVMFLASDESWRLRYRRGDMLHHRFWGNVLRWGAGEKLAAGTASARVGTDRLHYEPGSTVRVTARFSDPTSAGLSDASPMARIECPDGTMRVVDLMPRAGAAGYYEAEVDGLSSEGLYRVRVASERARRVLGADYPESLETEFRVASGFEPVEFTRLSANRAVPEEMARLTGGAVVDPVHAEEVSELFGAGRGTVVERVEIPLWCHWGAFLVLALAAPTSWFLRKRRGLA